MQMAKPQTRSETALQSAVMRFGDDAFRICYMHTKSGKETLTLPVSYTHLTLPTICSV